MAVGCTTIAASSNRGSQGQPAVRLLYAREHEGTNEAQQLKHTNAFVCISAGELNCAIMRFPWIRFVFFVLVVK
jgi:hypothetical protein